MHCEGSNTNDASKPLDALAIRPLASGRIIGAAQPDRRRTFHKGALDVVESGTAVEIYSGEVPLYPGAREGVNLPITLDGQTVGVIGVTGDPDKVRGQERGVPDAERSLYRGTGQACLPLAEPVNIRTANGPMFGGSGPETDMAAESSALHPRSRPRPGDGKVKT